MTDDVSPIVWMSDDAIGNPVLQLSTEDNVGVALRSLKAGESLNGLTVEKAVPKGHKVALAPIAAGDRVKKYAQTIGVARDGIALGEHIHTHNLDFQNNDAAHEFCSDIHSVAINSTDVFQGFKRGDGRVGTRNFIAVLSSVNCSATAVHHIVNSITDEILQAYPNVDGIAAFTHGTGCGMATQGEGWDNWQRVLAGYATHPNSGGVLFVGLGCEASQIQSTLSEHALSRGPLLCTMNIQTSGGHKKTVEQGHQHLLSMLPEVNKISRESCSASSLMLALQCGGSDAWSGVTANPALGYACDLLVAQGGTGVLAETPEVYGAEHLLTARAAEPETGQKMIDMIRWWENYTARNNGTMDNNPSPGNKTGGLTTILEKSLGAASKGGTTPLTGVFKYADLVTVKGFTFMDTPGYDPASVTGQIAGGCQIVCFTTGRGSAFGSKPAPTIKISTNTEMATRMVEDMDIDAGRILSQGIEVEAMGREIYQMILGTASGTQTKSEAQGLGDYEFVPWQIGAVM